MKSVHSVSTKRMKELDQIAIQEYGIPSLVLMENAGRGISELAANIPHISTVLVVAGKGNNGGDALVAARHLSNQGVCVSVVLLTHQVALTGDAKTNFEIIQKMKIHFVTIESDQKIGKFKKLIKSSDLVIDGIFGVGLSRPVSGFFAKVIECVNQASKDVISVDIPSGLDGDSGKILGACVKAKITGTLGVAKRGLFKNDGPKYAGEVRVIDISIPRELFESVSFPRHVYECAHHRRRTSSPSR